MSTTQQLEEQVGEGVEMSGFLKSPLGKKFKRLLEERYIAVITGALQDSPTYAQAAKEIEAMAAQMNLKLDIAKLAKKHLDRLGRQHIPAHVQDDDDDWG